jgi:hypothetical protein
MAEFLPKQKAYVELVRKKIMGEMSAAVESVLLSHEEENDADDLDDWDIYYGDSPQQFLESVLPVEFHKNGFSKLPAPPQISSTSGSQMAAQPSSSGSTASPSCSSSAGSTPRSTEILPSSSTSIPNPRREETLPLRNHASSNEQVTFEKKPTVSWTQTKEIVTIQIHIPDMKKYTLKIGEDKRSLTFTSQEPPNYSFELPLFGKVKVPVEENLLGQYLLIRMTKMSKIKWSDLSRDKEKRWWLKRDLENLIEDTDEEDVDEFPDWERGSNMNTKENEKPTKNRCLDSIPVDYEGDDSTSDSEDALTSEDELDEEFSNLVTS